MNDKGKKSSSRVAITALVALAFLSVATQPAFAEPTPAPAPAATGNAISGTVVDSEGEPIIGATVLIKGTDQGASTDLDGHFSIPSPKGHILSVSYIGYKPQEIDFTGKNDLTITMVENAELLEEVVVVGYGTQKKATMTGAVAVVSDKQLANKGTLASPVQALQGQVPGVIITRSSSAPGEEGWGMNLRGAVSKNSTEPLVIIDGIEYESVAALNQINSSDIESMNFLKDAAASIYGSKAAGGVVLITTKRAKDNKVRVDYNGSYTAKFIGLNAKQMSLTDWANAQMEAHRNDGYDDSYAWTQYNKLMLEYKDRYIDFDHSTNPISLFGDTYDLTFFDTDWQDIMWGNSWSTQHDLAVSGGKDGNNYRISLGYMYDDSNLKWGNNNNHRFNLRLNNSFRLSDKFTIESVIAFNRQDQVAPTQIGSALTTNTMQPGFPSSTKDGKPYGWGSNWRSPNWLCELGGDNKYKAIGFNISETLRYAITKELNAVVTVGYNNRNNTRDKKTLPIDFYNYAGTRKVFTLPVASDTQYEKWWDRRDFYSIQGYVDYTHTFANDHNTKFMAGVQYNMTEYESGTSTVKDITPSLEVINGSGETKAVGTKWQEAILSYYGRANYDFRSKYLFEAQARYDGSSKFQAENRWAFFWGTSAGWRLTEEAFMQDVRDWLTDLKLRASYGNVGNQSGIDRYSGTLLYNFHQNSGALVGSGLLSYIDTNGRLVSTDRTWERVHNYNVALDFGFFNSRLTGTVEAFWKKTNNMLIDVIYPGVLGDKAPTANYGKFKAWGYEGQVNWNDRIGQVNYHIGGTFTYADNELLDNGGSGAIQAGVRSDREGYPLNSVFGLRYCGKIQNEEQLKKYKDRYEANSTIGNFSLLRVGDNMYEDVNGDKKLDANDLVYLGTDDPKIQFSFNFGAEWRGFDVNVVFQGAAKRTVWRTTSGNTADAWRIPVRTRYQNCSDHFLGNVWSPENPGGYYPPLTQQADIQNYDYQCSSWSVEDGSYLRLKNVTLGYSLPANLLAKSKVFSNVRFYVTGTDLWEHSKIKDGWDPEARRTITNANRYPFLRTVTFGANISF